MPDDPLVGVVIPARDAERWVGYALESVLAQAHRPLDVVVVDDGSVDRTRSVAESYGPPIRVVSQEHGGIGAARNRGAGLVAGELIAFLDADDLWTATRLEGALGVLNERPEVDLVFGQVCQFAEVVDGVPVALDQLRPAHLVPGMLIRREAFERVGPFATGWHVAESLDWLLRARELRLAEVTLGDQVFWRRVHADNNSLRHRAQRSEYARALKASLDRRRALS